MPYVIAVIAPGAMGANVGRKLVEAGNIVLTSLEGRSDATRERAKKAGMVDASWSDIVRKSDIVLSIIPPRDAISFAERLLKEYDSANRLPENPLVFADCNAVNVVTIRHIATLITASPITFLDGCIIGGPPSGNYVPTFYGSTDPGSERGLKLFEDIVGGSGIKVRVLNGDGSRIGSASALKMSYAGISKGLTGLFTTIILAAHANSPATSEALLQELSDSQPELLERITRAVPAMIPKAYRWVGEMEEIAGFVGGGEGDIYHGMSQIYGRVERPLRRGTGMSNPPARLLQFHFSHYVPLDQYPLSDTPCICMHLMPLTVSTSIPAKQHDPSSLTPPPSASAPAIARQPSTSSPKGISPKQASRQSTLKSPTRPTLNLTPAGHDGDDATWGSNFWVTLVDPQSQTSFFACPATGQVSWDPPVGTFVLPPSEEGEWWELSDESRGGLPYYYQTKTGETKWERPSGFVIPLGILQNSAAGRRLSQTTFDHFSKLMPITNNKCPIIPYSRLSKRYRPLIAAFYRQCSSIASFKDDSKDRLSVPTDNDSPGRRSRNEPPTRDPESPTRPRSKSSTYTSHRAQKPQSLAAALEILSTSHSESGHGTIPKHFNETSTIESYNIGSVLSKDDLLLTPMMSRIRDVPPSPSRPVPETPKHRPTVGGKGISGPILNPGRDNHTATLQMSPVKNRATGKPISVESSAGFLFPGASVATLTSGTYPILPHALATDIQQFSESHYARQYFSTHRTGFIFRRRVPVAQLMTWQKAPLSSPLLVLKSTLQKDAVKVFKVIQHIMGDREREKPVNVRLQADNHVTLINSFNASTTSLSTHAIGILEEERWLLSEGLKHGELRDEIYCQLMKQLTNNPSKESIFKGWQLLCVLLITFPPSKNFETYLQMFIQNHTNQQEGRVDVMAKYCLRRLSSISKKGPRGKPPMIAEIETASDAAFNPSTFGESLDAIIRLQERNYPHQKIPIILPFLRTEFWRSVAPKPRLRIDRGYYTLDSVDDPHVLASLMNHGCNSKDPEACIQIVERLPTINRRVVLFVISFLQLFLEDRTQVVTKMTPANLALVMAPNLLRCNSESMAVVFTNAQYEQIFVYNLLLHLHCDEVDDDYKPAHGLGAVANIPVPKKHRNRSKRRDR
ncbi:hypothetical protein BJ912DRAFT_921356 [Pholiota molesta]|nr:hypothetical protein BJ912DRAFT_921356 [Pholiota molesta]